MIDANEVMSWAKLGGAVAIVLIGLAYLLGYWQGAKYVLRKHYAANERLRDEVMCREIERDGANERARMMLEQKEYFRNEALRLAKRGE